MKKFHLIICCLLSMMTVKGQETVVWGAEVVDISSEFSPYDYSAVQALQRPNVLPKGGDNPNAWRPKSKDKEEFIMVSFSSPIKAQQVAIAESENPGAVKAVYGYDSEYNEYLLFELAPRDLPIESRLLNLFFDPTSYEINAIKVVLEGSVSDGYNAIDAIGISASNIPINVLIKLTPGLNIEAEADRLGDQVNSDYIEHSPLVSPDGKRMYFSRQFHPDNIGGVDDAEDIWVSELDPETGEWLPAKNIGGPLNNEGPNFISSISSDGGKEVMILGNRYGKKGRMYTGVSMSTYENGSFSEPENIEVDNEYNYSPNADFFLVPGGEALLTSVERDDTYGARDLYVSFKNADGKSWSEPMNLGNDINTSGEDESPFLAQDGRTLYFSSDGYSGYGGSDIYVSFKLDDSWKKWSAPENLGPGVNKEGDEEYFSIPSSGQNLYFTRGEKGEDTDIFSFKVEDLFVDPTAPAIASVNHLIAEPIAEVEEVVAVEEEEPEEIFITVKGLVLNAKTNTPIKGATVMIERLPDGADIGQVATSASGAFMFTVRPGAKYAMVGKADGFISEDENFDFSTVSATDTIERNLMIHPIEKGEKIVLKNIFFDHDKWDLKTASFPELNRVLGYLKDNKIEKIAISAHTDSVGDPDYNMGLSGKRGRSVMNFFIKNGISRDRLISEAFGETQPVVPNDTRENRAKNRRVEFTIK